MFDENGITKRIISEENYNFLIYCKNNDGEIDKIQEYIKKQNWNYGYLTYEQLYTYLINVILEVCNTNQITNILTNEIKECFKHKQFKNWPNMLPIDYEDLCKMLIVKLLLLPVRKNINGESVDLYLIEKNGEIMTINNYNHFNKTENKNIRQKEL